VIHKLEEHVACTQAFERAIADHGWVLCRNEGTIEDATLQVVAEIHKVLGGLNFIANGGTTTGDGNRAFRA